MNRFLGIITGAVGIGALAGLGAFLMSQDERLGWATFAVFGLGFIGAGYLVTRK